MVTQPSTKILYGISVGVVACTDSWELKKRNGDQKLKDAHSGLLLSASDFFGCY